MTLMLLAQPFNFIDILYCQGKIILFAINILKNLSYLLCMNLDKFLKVIGERIRTIRKTKKITQEKLAELAELHPTYISNIECGKVNASIYSFYMIANALEIPFPELVNIPSVEMDKKIEDEIAVMVSQLRAIGRKKQNIFLSAAKGLIAGIEKI